MNPFVLFLSSNSTTGGTFVEKAIEMGMIPLLICKDKSRFSFVDELPVDVVQIDDTNHDAVRSFILNFAWHYSVAGIMSSSEFYQAGAAELARLLGLPAPDPDALRFCRSKLNQRRRLAEAGVGQPGFYVASTIEDASRAFCRIGGLAVIKPLDCSGSVGVRLVESREEAELCASILLGHTTNERGLLVDRRILVEEFLDGSEFSIEAFNGCVVGVTAKLVGARPFFVETGHTYPAAVGCGDRRKLEQIAVAAIQALGLTWGPVHVEAKLIDGVASIVEVNARLAGGTIPDLVELNGTDLISKTIAAATNMKPLVPASRFPAAAVRFVVPSCNGRIAALCGIDRARQMSGVQEIRMYKSLGERVRLRGDFRDRCGHVVAVGGSPEEAAANAEAALSQCRIVITDTEV